MLSYRRFGDGNKMLFCFHGYGEDALTFSFLEKNLGNEFTLIALDFPFHGLTEWNEEFLLRIDELIEIMNKISSVQSFSILGYSMGGRVALKLLQIIPDRIEKIILLAPDGLHNNFWHKISKKFFKRKENLIFSLK